MRENLGTHVRRRKVNFSGLRFIADRLNDSPQSEPWRQAEKVVSSSVTKPHPYRTILGGDFPSLAVDRFNRLAKRSPICLFVDQGITEKGRLLTRARTDSHNDPFSNMVWFLWRFFFQEGGFRRLKKCPQCGRWFVDRSKNRTAVRCSKSCSDKWWNRSKRLAVGHRLTSKRAREHL